MIELTTKQLIKVLEQMKVVFIEHGTGEQLVMDDVFDNTPADGYRDIESLSQFDLIVTLKRTGTNLSEKLAAG